MSKDTEPQRTPQPKSTSTPSPEEIKENLKALKEEFPENVKPEIDFIKTKQLLKDPIYKYTELSLEKKRMIDNCIHCCENATITKEQVDEAKRIIKGNLILSIDMNPTQIEGENTGLGEYGINHLLKLHEYDLITKEELEYTFKAYGCDYFERLEKAGKEGAEAGTILKGKLERFAPFGYLTDIEDQLSDVQKQVLALYDRDILTKEQVLHFFKPSIIHACPACKAEMHKDKTVLECSRCKTKANVPGNADAQREIDFEIKEGAPETGYSIEGHKLYDEKEIVNFLNEIIAMDSDKDRGITVGDVLELCKICLPEVFKNLTAYVPEKDEESNDKPEKAQTGEEIKE